MNAVSRFIINSNDIYYFNDTKLMIIIETSEMKAYFGVF